jgi:hypothetical protein
LGSLSERITFSLNLFPEAFPRANALVYSFNSWNGPLEIAVGDDATGFAQVACPFKRYDRRDELLSVRAFATRSRHNPLEGALRSIDALVEPTLAQRIGGVSFNGFVCLASFFFLILTLRYSIGLLLLAN